jgi:hypothetical protein
MKNVRVVRADRSPLNSKQWLVELECGHEGWVTATIVPKRIPECTQLHGVLGPKGRKDGGPMRTDD